MLYGQHSQPSASSSEKSPAQSHQLSSLQPQLSHESQLQRRSLAAVEDVVAIGIGAGTWRGARAQSRCSICVVSFAEAFASSSPRRRRRRSVTCCSLWRLDAGGLNRLGRNCARACCRQGRATVRQVNVSLRMARSSDMQVMWRGRSVEAESGGPKARISATGPIVRPHNWNKAESCGRTGVKLRLLRSCAGCGELAQSCSLEQLR